MPFKVTARTILQLGGELISSDGIAFYELIKNAFDAKSKRAFVEVVIRLPNQTWAAAIDKLEAWSSLKKSDELNSRLREFKQQINDAVVASRISGKWQDDLNNAMTVDELKAVVWDANYIQFRDAGVGMTLQDLDSAYLTVGTPKKLVQRAAAKKEGRVEVILGEKGIGRLSAMRLGDRLNVTTATERESHWNELYIDWREFGKLPGRLVGEVDVAPYRGATKKSGNGTTITIRGLTNDWTQERLQRIAIEDLSRFADPFAESSSFQISLKWNGFAVPVPRMSDLVIEHAHAIVNASLEYEMDDQGEWQTTLTGTIDYLVSGTTNAPISGYSHSFSCQTPEILSMLEGPDYQDVTLEHVLNLGPLTMKCFWFNRRLLKTIEVNDEKLNLRDLIAQWSGGLMVYRDGFRVPPYGGADDDWLHLDRKALASQAYKVNRSQIVGKVDITSNDNPFLVDQTNREGLRDCPEKLVLVALMKYVLETEFRGYIVEVDNELRDKERISFGTLSQRLSEVEERIESSLKSLEEADEEFPDYGLGEIENELRSAFKVVVGVVGTMQQNVEDIEGERERILFLASLGLSIEKLAHELNRATRHALDSIKNSSSSAGGPEQLRTATLQLTSLQRRLQNLDPMLSPTRQRKTTFDLVKEVESIISGHQAQFARHNISCHVICKKKRPVEVKLVRAMIVQVLENLIDNSVYWLSVSSRDHRSAKPKSEIKITIDGDTGTMTIWDSGPGVAVENSERVFRAFYTKKPAGKGKGLGLFISREIAEYHGGSLILSPEETIPGRLNTFVFDFGASRVEK
jgi:signal transduction histidine kinase